MHRDAATDGGPYFVDELLFRVPWYDGAGSTAPYRAAGTACRQAAHAEMDGTHPVPFAALLRRFRLAADLSQEELAERAKLSTQAVSDLERGVRRAPYRDTVDLLADALELTDEERAQLHTAVARRRGPPIAPAARPVPTKTNLRAQTTSFIGRE